ncbi:MAG: hypothetical protein ACT4NY_34535 [Pseudonocardiales bacterium]
MADRKRWWGTESSRSNADQVCAAHSALLAEYRTYAQAERDYQARRQDHHRTTQRPRSLAQAAARKARTADPTIGVVCALLGDAGDGPAPQAVRKPRRRVCECP